MSSVQSIERAFDVLAALADGPAGVTAVAHVTRLPKSTAARLLRALAEAGAVERATEGTDYQLGPRIQALAAGARRTRSLVELARPILTELAEEVGEAVGLSVAEGSSVRYVDQVDSAHPVAVRDWTGTRLPMHPVSSGRVFLAAMAPDERDRALARPLERFTSRTVTDPGRLRSLLREVVRNGVAWTADEYAEGITSVAAPVADAGAVVVAAVHIHGPSYRFPGARHRQAVERAVLGAAGRLSVVIRRA